MKISNILKTFTISACSMLVVTASHAVMIKTGTETSVADSSIEACAEATEKAQERANGWIEIEQISIDTDDSIAEIMGKTKNKVTLTIDISKCNCGKTGSSLGTHKCIVNWSAGRGGS